MMKAFIWFSSGLILMIVLAALPLGRGMSSGWADDTIIDHPQPDFSERVLELPTDQIIIQFKDIARAQLSADEQIEAQSYLSQAAGVELTYVRPMSGDAHVLKLPQALPEAEVNLIAARLMTLPEVAYAEPDAILFPLLTPNDTNYSAQWHFAAPGSNHYGINAPAAWDVITGTANIVVAVVDTGITNHQDLVGRILPGYDFITDIPTANDNDNRDATDSRDADPSDPGDWVTAAEALETDGPFYDCQVQNSSWHGTHVAGTIGAATNNGLGMAGINWNSKILPVRVLGKCGGYSSDIAEGMRWSAGLHVDGVPDNLNPAKVVNLSLGGTGPCLATYQQAIDAIVATGATVVASAGNKNEDASNNRPGNCSGVITVAATNRNGARAFYSNYGSLVEISAPGGETTVTSNGVLSTLNQGTQGPIYPSNYYAFYQGTSMAAPHVAGVASLLYSLSPSLTPLQVAHILTDTVTYFPLGSTCTTVLCGAGIVNAGQAVADLPHLMQVSPTYIEPGSGPITLTVSGANFNASSVIRWGNQSLATQVISTTQLTATLTVTDVNHIGTFAVAVVGNYPPYGSITTADQLVQVGEPLLLYLPLLQKNVGWSDILVEDFENTFPAGLWQLGDQAITGYTWGKSTCKSFAGAASAWVMAAGAKGPAACGSEYVVNMNSSMTYGPFSLSKALAAELNLQLWTNTENVFDNVCVGASEDSLNFYGQCYSGQSNSWASVALDLSQANTKNFLGKSQVWVRIYFESDISRVFPEGAFVDNLVIRQCLGGGCETSQAFNTLSDLNQVPWEMFFQP